MVAWLEGLVAWLEGLFAWLEGFVAWLEGLVAWLEKRQMEMGPVFSVSFSMLERE